MKTVITLISIMLTAFFQEISGANFETLVSLRGHWKFNIGDKKEWADPNFDDSKWGQVYAPSSWENQGYVGYDGYAWYRKKISVPNVSKTTTLYLNMGNIDDVCEIYFNGHKVGQMGVFPPHYVTAYNATLNFYLPVEYINFSGDNTIAVRVYDDHGDGGIVNGKLFIGIDDNNKYLSLDLSGQWKIAFKNDTTEGRKWYDINVPSFWETQGFDNYDGYAWYGKSFVLPNELANETLYLVLGKIDDKDKVYFNKKLIGTTSDMYNTPFDVRYKGDWQIRRAYKIPKSVIKPGEKNIIAVMVYDAGGVGGIHEGPVGIMTEDNFKKYVEANKEDINEYGINSLINLLINIFD